jgi:ABC-2 type transport system ATP-binding protein
MPAVLITHGLTRRFGKLTAVDALNLEVEAGEVFGLLGRNGAGKSTLIKMMTTLLQPSSGNATVAGYDVVRDAARVRRVIGYVPQVLSADGELTGYENLWVFSKLHDIPRAERRDRIRDAFDFMGLQDAADSLVKTYSGGMIRRLEIAQSMLHRPAVLFLDEPTVGLDPVAREAVWDHIRRLRTDYGTTIFLTTHYMDEAERLCTRIAMLRQGRVVATGSPGELKSALGAAGATLDDVFAHYTEGGPEEGGYSDFARTRRTVRRLG